MKIFFLFTLLCSTLAFAQAEKFNPRAACAVCIKMSEARQRLKPSRSQTEQPQAYDNGEKALLEGYAKWDSQIKTSSSEIQEDFLMQLLLLSHDLIKMKSIVALENFAGFYADNKEAVEKALEKLPKEKADYLRRRKNEIISGKKEEQESEKDPNLKDDGANNGEPDANKRLPAYYPGRLPPSRPADLGSGSAGTR